MPVFYFHPDGLLFNPMVQVGYRLLTKGNFHLGVNGQFGFWIHPWAPIYMPIGIEWGWRLSKARKTNGATARMKRKHLKLFKMLFYHLLTPESSPPTNKVMEYMDRHFLNFKFSCRRPYFYSMDYQTTLKYYDAAFNHIKNFKRKGKSMPYTSANGYMFSLVNKDGQLGIRLSEKQKVSFAKEFKIRPFVSHGATMKDYVLMPLALLRDSKALARYLKMGFNHVNSLPSK